MNRPLFSLKPYSLISVPVSMEQPCGHRYRFYPNPEQRQQLAQTFGCCRYIYNWTLARKTDAYHERGVKISYGQTDKDLTQLKKDAAHQWLREVSSVPLQQALRHLDRAYTNFFQKRAKFPRFKSRRHRQSVTYTRTAFRTRDSGHDGMPLVYLAKQSSALKIRWSRALPSDPTTVIVSKDSAGRYFISFRVNQAVEPLPPKTKAVGIDLGITDLVVTSDGHRSGNPKHYRRLWAKLRYEQKALSRKVKGSTHWERQRLKVARVQAKIADCRADFLHKLTTRLVRHNGVMCMETLRVKNMLKNHCLAGAISDASWGEFSRQLEYKASWYGREVVKIDTFFPSSKRCSSCGYVHASMPLSVRRFNCHRCGVSHQRDVNAAKNILAVGHTVSASGLNGRPAPALAVAGVSG